MASQQRHDVETGIQVQTRTRRKLIRRIAIVLAVVAIMAPTADAISANSTGSTVRYLPACGPIGYGGAPDSVGVDGPAVQYRPVCGPIGYGGAPDSVGVNGLAVAVSAGDQVADATNPLTVPSTEPGIDWRDASAGIGIGAALGLLAAGAALALKRRRRGLVGV